MGSGEHKEKRTRGRIKPCHPFVEQDPGPTNREPNSTTLVQHPPCCDAPLTNMGLQTQISRLLKSREDMMSSTPDDKPHASVIHKQSCDPIPTGGHLHMQDKMSNITRGEKKKPLTIVQHRVFLSFQQSHFASDEKYDTCHTVWHHCECAHHTKSIATSLL